MAESRQFSQVEYRSVGSSWGKVAGSAPWVSGQASGLNPGSQAAFGRRKNSKRYKARTKKVIRPRIRKHRSTTRKALTN